ncbi:MAG: hypothetical protein CMH83_10615 [Nocardioides sp.]|nr:hypothetical protein [Nocardioides sp.]
MIDRWADIVATRARLVLVAGILVVVGAATYGLGVFDALSQGGFDDPDSESGRELALERDTFGNQNVDVLVLYGADGGDVFDPAVAGPVSEVVEALPDDAVRTVVSYLAVPGPDGQPSPEAAAEAGLVSADGDTGQVLISLVGEDQDALLSSYREIEEDLEVDAAGVTTSVTGAFAVYSDVNEITSEDLERAEIISMPVVLLLALLIFGSLVAASMPVLVGLVAMVGALAVVRLLTEFTAVSVFSVNVVSLLGIGLAIDYALFVISRFREELALLPDDDPHAARTAVRRTLATAGRTVLFSGLTVAAAMSSLLIFPQMFLRSMGLGGMAAVLVAMLAALTILPAVLVLLGRRIDAGRLPWRRGRPVASGGGARWAALAHAVMRRPAVVIVLTVGLLLVVASPFLGVRWGSVDYRVLPADAPAHQAAVLLDEEFGPEASSARLLVTGADQATVDQYAADVAAVDGVRDVRTVVADDASDAVLLRATWEGNSQSETSQALVGDIRDVPLPDGEVLVGGLSAETVDLVASVGDHLPAMALIVVAIMLVLLFVAFGSVVLPLKAVVMNLVSITASFGVVTWIFSDGHLSGLLGFESQGYLDATNPILMLAVLFGLSMDYEVFLLSRVREEWDRTHDNDRAVATGVQKTGRIITSAALLLGVVIGAFGTSGIIFMKMLGVGMLVALLIDATIVRALLVPATMKLLGSWNWYAPGPLARWWERYGFREEPAEPAGPSPVAAPEQREPAAPTG